MLTLPQNVRSDVTIIDVNGTVHSNKLANLRGVHNLHIDAHMIEHPSMSESFAVARFDPTAKTSNENSNRRTVDEAGTPPTPANTGPYHRYFTQAGTNSAAGNLYLPSCSGANLFNTDAGYAYIESYGNDYYDTGLRQYTYDQTENGFFCAPHTLNYGTSIHMYVIDAHRANSCYYRVDGSTCQPPIGYSSYPLRVRDSQNVSYQVFEETQSFPCSYNEPVSRVLNVAGVDDHGNTVNDTFGVGVPCAQWPSDNSGGSVRLARVTSIAQPSDNLSSGEYWGINTNNGAETVSWTNSIASAKLVTPPGHGDGLPYANGGSQIYPNDPSKVLIQNFNYATENVGIYLHR